MCVLCTLHTTSAVSMIRLKTSDDDERLSILLHTHTHTNVYTDKNN